MIAMTTAVDGVAAGPPARDVHRQPFSGAVARAIAVLVPLVLAVYIALHLHTGSSDLTSWWLGDVVLAASLLVPGLLIALRRPGNAIGWLLLTGSVTTAVAGAGREYLAYGFLGGSAPGYLWIGWVADSLYIVSMATLPLILMLFPDGRAMSRRTRPLLLVPVVGAAVGTFGSLFFTDREGVDVQGQRLYNPARHAVPGWLADLATNAGMLLFFAGVVISIALLLARYRRSTGEARLQMKWVVWAGTIGVFELATEMIPNNQVSQFTGPVASSLLTASVCIAILRHRMFDIDVVINRTLVFAALTAVVVAGYVAVVGLLSAALGQPVRLGIGVVATALLAVVFAPARDRVQRAVDRLMYGERKNPYGVITQLGRRLDHSGEHGELTVIVDTVSQALKLPYAAILDADGGLLAQSGRQREERYGEPHLEPLSYQGVEVGTLAVQPRGSKGRFTPDERRLLADLSRQIGAAVHAVGLSRDLQASRERLVNAKEEERRRLRRDLHDGLGPKLAALALKLDAARSLVDARPERSKRLLADVTGDIRGTIEDIRQLVYALRPPALDELGLVGALRECVERFGSGGAAGLDRADAAVDGAVPSMSVQAPGELSPLPAAVEVALYWIVNEAVTNVVRHASARHCQVRLELGEGAVLLSVRDDGTGLPANWRAGVGTASMAERAAELGGTLMMRPPKRGAGTCIDVAIPVPLPTAAGT